MSKSKSADDAFQYFVRVFLSTAANKVSQAAGGDPSVE